MNAFFDMAAEAIETEGGMIDKFMGDGFMALFTEGFTGPDHADRAVAASRKLARDVRAFNLGRGREGAPRLTMRIGMNTGLLAIGEVGARSRANPTAVGDVVNVAARLEQLGRDLFANEREIILLSGVTFHYLKSPPQNLIDCGEKNIRGRKTPVKVISPDIPDGRRFRSPPKHDSLSNTMS
jgi:adenylate cyclase